MTIQTIAVVRDSGVVKTSKNKITVVFNKKLEKSFKFDGVYGIQTSTNDVCDHHLKKLIDNAMSGYSFSVVEISDIESETVFMGFQGDAGLIDCVGKMVFSSLEKNPKNDFLVTASMMQVNLENQLIDLINPHPRKIEAYYHSHYGLVADGVSHFICQSPDDVVRYFEDGRKVSQSLHQTKFATVFNLKVQQRVKGHMEKESHAVLSFVEISSNEKTSGSVKSLLTSVAQEKTRSGRQEPGPSGVKDLMLHALLANNNAVLLAYAGGIDPQDTADILGVVEALNGVGNSPKANTVSTPSVLQQLRDEIDKVRNRLATQTPPNKNDLAHMEKLVKDLEETKRNSWDQTILRSELFFEERKTNLASKGLLWIIEASPVINRENLAKLQKLREKLSKDYQAQRQAVDKITYELKSHVDNYTLLVQSGKQSDGKQLVSLIQDMKDKLKTENDKLNKVQAQLNETQDQLQNERQAGVQETSSSYDVTYKAMIEEHDKTKKENEQLVEEELRRMRVQLEHDKADIQMKLSSGGSMGQKEILDQALLLASLKAEKLVMTTQLEAYKREKVQLVEHMRVLAEKHRRELEIQELQNLQTFRAYREVFEDFKVDLETRWRGLLDDAIQDAVFLNARNNDLMQANASLTREVAELKDSMSIKMGVASTGKL